MKEWGDATLVASPHCLFLYLVVLLTCSVKRRVVKSWPADKKGLAFGYSGLASRFLGPCVAPADKVRLNGRSHVGYGRNCSSNDALCPGTCTQGTLFSLCGRLRPLYPGVLASSMTKAPPKCMAVSSPAHSSFIDSAGSIVTSRTKQA